MRVNTAHITPWTPRARRGVALIDAIIAAIMLGIGLATLLSLNSRALLRQVEGERKLQAAWLADELLSMVVVEGPDQWPRMNDSFGRFEPPFQDFEYEMTFDPLGPHEPYRVTATVRWNGGGQNQVQVQSLIAVRGGDLFQPRIPLEYVDRDARWNPVEESSGGSGG